nr:chromate transporter [Azospira sp.]
MLADLFFQFALLFCVAFGGASALLPEMHRVVVLEKHWLDDATFTHLYAIAQAAPGPNGLVVSLIGWEVAGVPGALAASLGMVLPTGIMIYLLMQHWHRFAGACWQQSVQLGVAPLAVGLVFAAAFLIGQAAGFGWGGVLLAGLTAAALLKTKWHPLWLIGLGGVAGLLGWV